MAPHIKSFKNAALIAVVINSLASGVLFFILRPGLDSSIQISERLSYIHHYRLLWVTSWCIWILAAVSLIYFFVHWGVLLEKLSQGKHRTKVIFGVLIGTLGMIPDTIAETLYTGLLPRLAEQGISILGSGSRLAVLEFFNWEQVGILLTGFLGNGFYCIGGLTLNLVALNIKRFPRKWALACLPVWIFSFTLSVAALIGSTLGLMITTALTMASFVLWTGCVGFFFPEKGTRR